MADNRFYRQYMLLGSEAMEKLKDSRVAVFGLGGVGSWCAEALARAGVGNIMLVDSDFYSETNINRQIGALSSTVGRPKSGVMAERCREINPGINAAAVTALYESGMIEGFDYVADCIDMVSAKLDLIETCNSKNIPVISAMGTGNKKDASLLELTDISKTKNDGLARVMRKELRSRGILHLDVVYSPEEAMDCLQEEAPPPGKRSVPGSLVWVPATAGLLMAQKIILSLSE